MRTNTINLFKQLEVAAILLSITTFSAVLIGQWVLLPWSTAATITSISNSEQEQIQSEFSQVESITRNPEILAAGPTEVEQLSSLQELSTPKQGTSNTHQDLEITNTAEISPRKLELSYSSEESLDLDYQQQILSLIQSL